jgi:phosphoglucosamine mutase
MGRYFGTDGIRGVAGQEPLTTDFFLRLGTAAGEVIRQGDDRKTVIIGRDTRHSGQALQSALTAGLLSSGLDVIDAGVFPTAGIAWLIRHLQLDAGMVISASHNPAEQNGVKFIDAQGLKFAESLEDEIERKTLDGSRSSPGQSKRTYGRIVSGATLPELYIQGLLEEHPGNFLHGLNLLLDCSNGAASAFAPEVFSRLGANVVTLSASPDGMNINRGCGSEFARRSPWEVHKLIRHHQANFGMAFDGDADRVVFIDESGQLIDGDHMLGFLARYLEGKGLLLAGAVVTTQMRNTGLKLFLEAAGLKVFETPVGDKYVVDKLLELRRLSPDGSQFGLGGEQAGHIDITNAMFTTGDGIRTALFVLRAYLESGLPSLREFAAGVGKTPQIIASAFVGFGPRFNKPQLAEMQQGLESSYPGLSRVNIRYSGTEPLLRVMLESDGEQDESRLAEIAWELCRTAQTYSGAGEAEIDILNCTHGGVIIPVGRD